MPVNYVNSGAQATTAGATISPALPASIVTGNFLFAVLAAGAGGVPTVDAAWTLISTYTNGYSTDAVAYRIATGSDTAPTWSGLANNSSASVAQYSGINSVTTNKVIASGSAAARSVGPLTLTTDNASAICFETMYYYGGGLALTGWANDFELYTGGYGETSASHKNLLGAAGTVVPAITGTGYAYYWGMLLVEVVPTPSVLSVQSLTPPAASGTGYGNNKGDSSVPRPTMAASGSGFSGVYSGAQMELITAAGSASLLANISTATLELIQAAGGAVEQGQYPATITATITRITANIINPNHAIKVATVLPIPYAVMDAATPQNITVAGTVPVAAASITGLAGGVVVITASLPVVRAAATGWSATVGTISAKVPAPNMMLGGYAAIMATVAARLLVPQTAIIVTGTALQTQVMVTNLLTKSVTFYKAYPFNSFAQIGDSYFAAGPNGFYKLELDPAVTDGDFDGTVLNPIDAVFRFGENSLGSEMQKRVSDCYAAMRAESVMTVRVYVDEADPMEYTLDPVNTATVKQRRVPIGKGAKGKYWQFEVENNAGGNFDFDTINIAAVPLSRRL
jgi:hypothetical protein